LNRNHDESLYEQRRIESRAWVVEYSAQLKSVKVGSEVRKSGSAAYFSIDATSIINGISSENPALDFVRCIEYIWSAYEVMGETMMKIGATKPVMKDTRPILKECQERDEYSKGGN
jgi:hypothetical protein